MSGHITHLFLKEVKGQPMKQTNSISLVKGLGIVGDKNAYPISPRQVLITRHEDLQELNIPFGGLRENIIVRGLKVVDFQPCALVQIGAIKVRLTFHCEPCKRIADVVPSMVEVMCRRGILGVVLEGGKIDVNDEVECTPNQFKPFSDKPYDRFVMFMENVPTGKVVNYKMITIGMGVAESYLRAMPKYIENAKGTKLPLHRIVDTEGGLIERYIPNQSNLLQGEGVKIIRNTDLFSSDNNPCVNLSETMWEGAPLYQN